MKHAIKTLLSTAGLEIRHSSTLDRFLLKFDQVNTKTFLYLGRMLGLITHLDGGVVECGVGEARTFQMLALLLQEENKGRSLWGFDSFEGFPEPSAEDTSPRNPKKGEWKRMTRSEVYEILKSFALPRLSTSGRGTSRTPSET